MEGKVAEGRGRWRRKGEWGKGEGLEGGIGRGGRGGRGGGRGKREGERVEEGRG